MNEPTSDELLSAFLDGEVTAEEQARAELLLAEDQQAGRLFEELRTLGTCLQELPRQSLPDDFASRVLGSAERQVLKGPVATSGEPAKSPPVETWIERFRRPLAYVALVLAASVMIMIFAPDKSGDERFGRDVAQGPTMSTSTEAPVAEEARFKEAPSIVAAPLTAPVGDEAGGAAAEGAANAKLAATKKQSEPDTEGFGIRPANDRPAIMSKARAAQDDRTVLQRDSGLLVVTCEITPAAAQQDAFRRVLTRNSISLDDLAEGRDAQAQAATPMPESAKRLSMDAAKSGLEVVYVEASAEQLESTLAEMASQPKDFLTVDVGAAETQGLQNRWQEQYSRGRGGLVQQRSLETNLAITTQKPAAKQPAEEPARVSGGGSPAAAPAGPRRTDPAQQLAPTQQQAGRARGYAMPAEGLNTQRSGREVMLQQQQAAQPGSAAATAASTPGRPGEPQRVPQQNRPLAEGEQEPATLRALFVLRVTDEPSVPAAASPK